MPKTISGKEITFEIVENMDSDAPDYFTGEKCEYCGADFPDFGDDELIVCVKCHKRKKVKPSGTKNKGKYVRVAYLGHELGKHSWCSMCRNFSKNVPGSTYLHQSLADKNLPYIPSLYEAKREWHPDYSVLVAQAYEIKLGMERYKFWDTKITPLPPQVPTLKQLQDRFFACENCGHEKFWDYSYQCERCDYDQHWLIEMTPPVYNYGAAMECGGNPHNWDELWKCKACGYEYWIGNSDY